MSNHKIIGESFKWTIENFSFCHLMQGDCLISPAFTVPGLCYDKWYLLLYPREMEYLDYISCLIFCENHTEKSAREFDYKIELIGGRGKILAFSENKSNCTKEIFIGRLCFFRRNQAVSDEQNATEDSLTVCCYIYTNNPNKEVFGVNAACTKIGVDRTTVKFDECFEEVTKYVSYHPNLCLRFNIFKLDNNLNVKAHILTMKRSFLHFLVCKWTLKDLKGHVISKEETAHFLSTSKEGFRKLEKWKFQLATISRALHDHKKNNPLDTSLHFVCELSYSNGTETTSDWNATLTDTLACTSNVSITDCSSLRNDLRSMFLSKKLSDIKLRVGQEVVEAHKNILSARSPVFSAMFDQNMTETNTGIVDIVDVDLDALKLFLRYLYTDDVKELDYESAQNVLLVADKYQVLSLKEKCCSFLTSVINVENACEILTLADLVSDANLKEVSIDFIVANTSDILSSPNWRVWMKNNMGLATDIFTKLTSMTLPAGKSQKDDT